MIFQPQRIKQIEMRGNWCPRWVKRLQSPQLLRMNSLDLDKLHLRTLIKLASQITNLSGWSGRLEKCSFDFHKKNKVWEWNFNLPNSYLKLGLKNATQGETTGLLQLMKYFQRIRVSWHRDFGKANHVTAITYC